MKLEKQPQLFLSVQELIEKAQQNIVRNVNSTMVTTYFQIGRMIVEDEQGGSCYAEYGTNTMIKLSQHLAKVFGRGYSVDNLQSMRLFYTVYKNYETLSRNLPMDLKLSWSHYVTLLKVKETSMNWKRQQPTGR